MDQAVPEVSAHELQNVPSVVRQYGGLDIATSSREVF